MSITTIAPEPVQHFRYDPTCPYCPMTWRKGVGCSTVCSACGCFWQVDETGDPNAIEEGCEPGRSCKCHDFGWADQYLAAEQGDAVEAPWKDAGYGSSIEVWQAEVR